MYIHNTTLNFKLLSMKTCQIYNILENFTFFFKFYFIFKLYIIVLVLPNIKINPP